ncbi:glycoside hydrolase family 88/105 protein [Spirosoma utsteinense]|uniref:Rhamnogalacturonyl hydrolase YesR n=1 Tax=Spirosoma utsteinense TaxID=2585773 RepID=A0ABR6W9Y8_9BACT|nr:glycoside hydrolase family 88 protein [Spirosoma utsteinense]MBC3787377.1 rhamnogalacturonyl hydrolase YesR [Spirosoma utsteinense]MBC3793069.1 rhamnogalacturonyl hydrolase YesR [Spirosoma utsteinense]
MMSFSFPAFVLRCLLVVLLLQGSFATPPGYAQKKPDLFSQKVIHEVMIRTTDWQLAHPKHSPTDWTNGAFYAGVFAVYETTKSPKILDSLLVMGERNKWQPGPRFDHADDIAICQTYINLYRIKKDQRMIQATIDTVQKMRRVAGPEVKKHGITWWWCDALFMAPPVLAQLSATLNDPAYLAFNDSLFRQTYDLLYSQPEHLYARDGSYLIAADGTGKRESNGQKIFWSRGNGWVMGGLVKLLAEMPKNHPSRSFYLTQYLQMSERLLALQQPDGLWRSSLLDPAAYPGGEGSGSGFDCYALAWGINQGILPRSQYLPAVRKAWVALNGLVSPEGRVGWVQPIGGDPRRNFNAESWEVYGTGAFLLAGSEVVKLKK